MVGFTLEDDPPASPPDTGDAHLGDIADTLVSEIPEPQQHAIDEERAKQAAEGANASGAPELDALGIPWDASLHATSADGSHPKTAKGTWKKRRGLKGSPSVLRTGNGSLPPGEGAQPTAGPPNSELQARAAGAMAGTLFIRTAMMVGGEDFTPRMFDIAGEKVSEERMMQDAFGTYFAAKQMTDVPPGIVLTFTILSYIAPRMTMPRTREKTRGFFVWLKTKIANWKIRRDARKQGRSVDARERAEATDAEIEQ